MTEGITAYEEKPREQWLFDYPAQVSSDPSSGALLLHGLCRPPGAARLTHASGSGEAGQEGVSRRDQGIVSHNAIQRLPRGIKGCPFYSISCIQQGENRQFNSLSQLSLYMPSSLLSTGDTSRKQDNVIPL